MVPITKSFKVLGKIGETSLRNGIGKDVNLHWSTLHSLLHSERTSCRRNGYIWLGDLLISEINEEKDASIWSNIKTLRQRIADAGASEYSVASEIPLSVWLFCGLLKSKHNSIRWGFLFVLERLLMRCKFLLDEKEMQRFNSSGPDHSFDDSRLKKANAVIDIMSSALLLVFHINETDRMNILKVCCLQNPS